VGFRLKRAAVVHRFATACRAGSIGALRSMLAPDVTVVCDGGGKVPADLDPVGGADAVARRVIDLVQPDTSLTIEAVNGEPGVVLRSADAVLAVVSLKVVGSKIGAVWIVLNPDKLRHWA